MTERDTTGIFSFTAPVTAVWVNVIKPRSFKEKANGQEKGEPKYDCMFLFKEDHPDFTTLKQRAVAVCKAKWPGLDIPAAYKAGDIRMPWITGDKLIERKTKKLTKEGKTYDGGYDFLAGNICIKSSSKYQPRLSVIANGNVLDLTEDTIAAHKGKFYGGVLCLPQVNLVAYDAKKDDDKDGVTTYLNMMLSLNKGEKIGGSGGPSAAEVFKGYVGTMTTMDPTAGAGMDDDLSGI
jgi:hypothetical protein